MELQDDDNCVTLTLWFSDGVVCWVQQCICKLYTLRIEWLFYVSELIKRPTSWQSLKGKIIKRKILKNTLLKKTKWKTLVQNWPKQHKECTKCVITLCWSQVQRRDISPSSCLGWSLHVHPHPQPTHHPLITRPISDLTSFPRPCTVSGSWGMSRNKTIRQTGGDIFNHVTCESLMAPNAQGKTLEQQRGLFRMLHGADTLTQTAFEELECGKLARVLELCTCSLCPSSLS